MGGSVGRKWKGREVKGWWAVTHVASKDGAIERHGQMIRSMWNQHFARLLYCGGHVTPSPPERAHQRESRISPFCRHLPGKLDRALFLPNSDKASLDIFILALLGNFQLVVDHFYFVPIDVFLLFSSWTIALRCHRRPALSSPELWHFRRVTARVDTSAKKNGN